MRGPGAPSSRYPASTPACQNASTCARSRARKPTWSPRVTGCSGVRRPDVPVVPLDQLGVRVAGLDAQDAQDGAVEALGGGEVRDGDADMVEHPAEACGCRELRSGFRPSSIPALLGYPVHRTPRVSLVSAYRPCFTRARDYQTGSSLARWMGSPPRRVSVGFEERPAT